MNSGVIEPASTAIEVWGYRIPGGLLDGSALEYLRGLPVQRPDVGWVWAEMDRLWDALAARPELAADRSCFLTAYYSHPVWLLNGIFTATDPESIGHRQAIAACVEPWAPARIADYGGGFGELSRAVAARLPGARIDIIEPFPNPVGRAAVQSIEGVQFAADFDGLYDVVLAQDVLEHVEQPLELAIRMAEVTRPGGHLVFANCFWPVIKCHLPETFYLRYTFVDLMQQLGLEYLGAPPGAPHAQMFRRGDRIDAARCRRRDPRARMLGGLLNGARDVARSVWRSVRPR